MEHLRPLLTTYAYNILGSAEEAKDLVQDVFLKYTLTDTSRIANPEAYLKRMVVNRSLDAKKEQQRRVLYGYPGPWLPEPVNTAVEDDMLARKELLSYSLLVLLERLEPRARAVFILKEAFDHPHQEIAQLLDITPEHSRQLLSRAKKQLQETGKAARYKVGTGQLQQYLHLIQAGDPEQLAAALREDIMVLSDGGGKAVAFRRPILGRKHVAALLLGIHRKFYDAVRLVPAEINHTPALLFYVEGQLVNCQILIFGPAGLEDIFFIRNPDKLRALEKNFQVPVT